MEKMFFKSDKVPSHWDTWLYFHEGTYYLYYLAEDKGHWGGFGAAVSEDGVSWEDKGLRLVSSEERVQYLGTGSVWKSVNFDKDKTFICNYSEWHADKEGKEFQRIFFATSKDLLNWQKCGPETVFDADTRLYEKYGRWDCICPIPAPDGTYFGTWTATPKGRTSLQGGIGFGKSRDGLAWEAVETGGIFPDADESGAVAEIDGRFYAMFGRAGKMVGYSADKFNGPYKECPGNAVMLSDYTYFSRFFMKDGEVLVNHHAITRFKSERDLPITYMAPLKVLRSENGGMRLNYWHGNDKLKSMGKKTEGRFTAESAFIEGRLKNGESVRILAGDEAAEVLYKDGGLVLTCGDEGKTVREPELQETVAVKILLKESVFEVYFDDRYMASFSLKGNASQIVAKGFDIYQIKD